MGPIGLADAWQQESIATGVGPLKPDTSCLVYNRQVRAPQQQWQEEEVLRMGIKIAHLSLDSFFKYLTLGPSLDLYVGKKSSPQAKLFHFGGLVRVHVLALLFKFTNKKYIISKEPLSHVKFVRQIQSVIRGTGVLGRFRKKGVFWMLCVKIKLSSIFGVSNKSTVSTSGRH